MEGATLNNDEVILSTMLNDIHLWQKLTKTEWERSDVVDDSIRDNHKMNPSVDGDVVIDFFSKRATVMPCYKSYKLNWSKYDNPFEVEWILFNDCNILDLKYLRFAIQTLSQQQFIWGVDEATKWSLPFGFFATFLNRLDGLYQYLLFSKIKKHAGFLN